MDQPQLQTTVTERPSIYHRMGLQDTPYWIKPRRLLFGNPQYEEAFLHEFGLSAQLSYRAIAALAGIGFVIAGFWDPPFAGTNLTEVRVIRYGLVVSTCTLFFWLTFYDWFPRWSQHFVLIGALVVAGGFAGIAHFYLPTDNPDAIMEKVRMHPGSGKFLASWLLFMVFHVSLVAVGAMLTTSAILYGLILFGTACLLAMHSYQPNMLIFSYGTFVGAAGLLISCIGSWQLEIYRRISFANQNIATSEHQRSEALLLNVLPAPIAERLKAGETEITDSFAEATVLFMDLVGFTKLSQSMPADKVVELLTWVFSGYDVLLEKYQLEKIKTIGDAYMVTGGLPIEKPGHAATVANMALELRKVTAELGELTGHDLQVRIGIHTGPVIAGVIGLQKFSYDLWGDTVNTAARMESHSEAGKIQVTEAVYHQLKEQFDFTPRGVIEVKGKGPMSTWFLEGAKSPHG